MKKVLESNIAKIISFILTSLALLSVNSACYFVLGQEKEPDSLKRFKRYL